MSDQFEIWSKFAFEEEGGWTDDPQDPGGPTNMGFTMVDMRQFSRHATIDDLRALTKSMAVGMQQALDWQPLHGWELPGGVSIMVADHGLNRGIGTSAMLLQQLIGVRPDGWIGPITVAAARKVNPGSLIEALTAAQEAQYRSLLQFPIFGSDWLARTGRRSVLALANA